MKTTIARLLGITLVFFIVAFTYSLRTYTSIVLTQSRLKVFTNSSAMVLENRIEATSELRMIVEHL